MIKYRVSDLSFMGIFFGFHKLLTLNKKQKNLRMARSGKDLSKNSRTHKSEQLHRTVPYFFFIKGNNNPQSFLDWCWYLAPGEGYRLLPAHHQGGGAIHRVVPAHQDHSTLLVMHRRKKKEEKENVVAAGWQDELECRTSKNDLKKKRFWENIHFGRVVVWYGVSRMIINFSTHPFRQVFFYSSVSSKIILVHNSQCGKESNQFHPPKQEQGSLPCLSSLSFLPCYKCFFTFHF